jgi:hypothetical protein
MEISSKRQSILSNGFKYSAHTMSTHYGKRKLSEGLPYKFQLQITADKPTTLDHVHVDSIQVYSLPDEQIIFEESPGKTVYFDKERYENFIFVNHNFKNEISSETITETILAKIKFTVFSKENKFTEIAYFKLKKYKIIGKSNLPIITH